MCFALSSFGLHFAKDYSGALFYDVVYTESLRLAHGAMGDIGCLRDHGMRGENEIISCGTNTSAWQEWEGTPS